MADLSTIGIRADFRDIVQADKALDRLGNTGAATERQVTKATGLMNAAMVGLAAAAAAAALGFTKLLSVAREFDVLNAQLKTATGSADAAAMAFEAIQDFATTTPYSLQQATKAFTQLVNLGLTPSEKALRSYGNTASAMGKDLSQMVEAVADAATGEFERLKEFGIKAKVEGDNVSFRFRGTTTTIKNSAEEIEKYLIGLGEINFATAMADRMATLDGAISNLSDSWDAAFRNISNAGAGELIADGVKLATAALDEFNAGLASGETEMMLDAWFKKFESWGRDISVLLDDIGQMFVKAGEFWHINMSKSSNLIIDAFRDMPDNIRAFIQIITVEIAAFVDKASVYGKAIADGLNPFGESSPIATQIAAIDQARLESLSGIIKERDTAIASFNEQIAASESLREAYDKKRASVDKSIDRLAAYKVGSESVAVATKAEKQAAQKLKDEYINIVNSLDPLVKKQNDLVDNVKTLDKALAAGAITSDQYTDAIVDLYYAFDYEKQNKATKAFNDQTKALNVQKGAVGKTKDQLEIYMSVQEAIAYGATPEMINQIELSVKALQAQRASIGESAKISEKAAERIESAFADAWLKIDEGFSGVLDGMKDAFKRTLAEMAHSALTAPLAKALGGLFTGVASGSAVAGTASSAAAAAGGASLVAGATAAAALVVVAGIDRLNSKDDERMAKFTAAVRQAEQSIGTVLGDSLAKSNSIDNSLEMLNKYSSDTLGVNRQMLDALRSVSSGISNLSASLVSGSSGANLRGETFTATTELQKFDELSVKLMKSIPIVGDIFGGLYESVAKTIFNKKTSLQDSGILIAAQNLVDVMTTGMVDAMQYQQIKTTKSFLGIKSSKTSQKTSELDDVIQQQFADIFIAAGNALDSASDVFGIKFDDFASKLTIKMQSLSLKGLEGDALEKELQNWFSATVDGWAGVLTSGSSVLREFQKNGEGAFETMIRLASETAAVNGAIKSLGLDIAQTGESAIRASQLIIEVSGGIDALQSSLNVYYASFYTEAERNQVLATDLAAAFASLGQEMPTTREGFRSLVDGLDLSTEAGQRMFAALMQLVPSMDQYLTAIEQQTLATQQAEEAIKQARVDAANEAFAAVQRSIDAEKERINTILKGAQEAYNATMESLQMQRNAIEENYIALVTALDEQKNALDAAYSAEKDLIQSAANARIEQLNNEIDMIRSIESQLQSALSAAGSLLDRSATAQIDSINSAAAARIEQLNQEIDLINSIRSQLELNLSSASGLLDRSVSAEINAINAASEQRIDELNAEKSAIQEAADLRNDQLKLEASIINQRISDLTVLSGSLRSALGGVSQATAQASLKAALQAARGGNFNPAIAMQDQFSSLGGGTFASAVDAARDAAITKNRLSELAKLTDGQMTIEQRMLAATESQAVNVEAQLTAIDKQIELEQENAKAQIDAINEQIDSVKGVDKSITSLTEAIKQYQSAQLALDSAGTEQQISAIELQIAAVQDGSDAQVDAIQQQIDAVKGVDKSVVGLADAIRQYQDAQAALTEFAADNQVALLEQQIEQAQSNADMQLSLLEQQYNAALGIDTSVKTLTQAISDYQAAQLELDAFGYEQQLAGLTALEAIAKAQFDSATDAAAEQIAKLDEQLALAQMQINAINGVNDSILSVADAIAGLVSTIAIVNTPIPTPEPPPPPPEVQGAQQGVQSGNTVDVQAIMEQVNYAMTSVAKSTASTAKSLQRIEQNGLEVQQL